jgi:isopenicillin N synthase-like dioxygenase
MTREPDDPKLRGVEASNRDFIRYEQVDKRQAYQLAEGEIVEAFDEDFRIRTCDMRKDPETFARELGLALEEIGFAILEGHGIDPALHEEAERAVMELFTKVPESERLRFRASRFGSVNQGYFPMTETSNIHPDLVCGWVFCRRAFDPARKSAFWPEAPGGGPGFERPFKALCEAQEALILPIMQSILLYLGCDPHQYDRRLSGTNFGLRLNYYPPVPQDDALAGAGRLLGHEDTDLFTLLPAPRIEGLQVLNRRNMKWIRLEAPPGTIILNTGDYMQRITNDRLPSTTHRVSRPRDPVLSQKPRVSFPMNVYLWEDELLEGLPELGAPKYEPIRAETFHTRITSKYYGDDYATEPAKV